MDRLTLRTPEEKRVFTFVFIWLLVHFILGAAP